MVSHESIVCFFVSIEYESIREFCVREMRSNGFTREYRMFLCIDRIRINTSVLCKRDAKQWFHTRVSYVSMYRSDTQNDNRERKLHIVVSDRERRMEWNGSMYFSQNR